MFPLPHGEAIAATLAARFVVMPGKGRDLFLDSSVAEVVVGHLATIREA